jgi:hypothetical protein
MQGVKGPEVHRGTRLATSVSGRQQELAVSRGRDLEFLFSLRPLRPLLRDFCGLGLNRKGRKEAQVCGKIQLEALGELSCLAFCVLNFSVLGFGQRIIIPFKR